VTIQRTFSYALPSSRAHLPKTGGAPTHCRWKSHFNPCRHECHTAVLAAVAAMIARFRRQRAARIGPGQRWPRRRAGAAPPEGTGPSARPRKPAVLDQRGSGSDSGRSLEAACASRDLCRPTLPCVRIQGESGRADRAGAATPCRHRLLPACTVYHTSVARGYLSSTVRGRQRWSSVTDVTSRLRTSGQSTA
jgi:hypothetical protein